MHKKDTSRREPGWRNSSTHRGHSHKVFLFSLPCVLIIASSEHEFKGKRKGQSCATAMQQSRGACMSKRATSRNHACQRKVRAGKVQKAVLCVVVGRYTSERE